MAQGALSGLRLIEMGQLIAGPFCGQLMGDHGAEVIKIEPPKVGDAMRNWGQGIPLWFSVVARNKKSITLNLREKDGQQIVRKLAEKADFLLENFRPGTLERWNLGWEELHAINEALIMIRVSGYGQTGPYSSRAGYGGIGEAMGGMRYIAGEPDRPPSRAGLSIGDSLAATYACLGALMALNHRHNTGKGQMVDSAIYESVLAMMESTIPEFTVADHIRERTGSILPRVAPSNVYPTKDGSVLVAGNQDSVWKRMATMMGVPELGDDPRYNSHMARGERQAELDDLISDWTRQYTSREVLDLCEQHGVPAGNMYRAPEMLEDPHFAARQAIVDVPHPLHDNFKMQNVAPKLSETPGNIGWVGPELGQHNEEIYGELLGMDTRTMDALAERGII
ncbi:CaiB/BaiF CoA transferase family protein [Erythrobacter sp. MTPC3]|uniref:CaiB/BaiF CoA transferase family protein n=1 Tax=Erythrobacter sp. MTPC3 TaxID=3056564 RepID=UPI0036F1A610